MKKFEDLTFRELVEAWEGEILQELIKGKFHSGVFGAMDAAIRWHVEQQKKKELTNSKKKV